MNHGDAVLGTHLVNRLLDPLHQPRYVLFGKIFGFAEATENVDHVPAIQQVLLVLGLFQEAWSTYPINRIKPTTISNYMSKLSETVSGSTINRRLDVISSMYTTFKKEYGYPNYLPRRRRILKIEPLCPEKLMRRARLRRRNRFSDNGA